MTTTLQYKGHEIILDFTENVPSGIICGIDSPVTKLRINLGRSKQNLDFCIYSLLHELGHFNIMLYTNDKYKDYYFNKTMIPEEILAWMFAIMKAKELGLPMSDEVKEYILYCLSTYMPNIFAGGY